MTSGRRDQLLAALAVRPNPLAAPAVLDAVEAVVSAHAPEHVEGDPPGRVHCCRCGDDITDTDCPDVAAFAAAFLPPPPPGDDGPLF